MNKDADQLSATFAAHEHLAPDAADVLAKARGIARSYQRRRWAVRATGGAVLGAGLVVSGVALPRIGNASSNQTINTLPIAAGGASTSSAPTTTFTDAQGTSAYFAAGYDYNDAVQLEALWNDGKTINQVKAEAGIKLLEGDTLPVQPSGTPESKTDQSVAAFFAAGYTYDDAVTLGNMWNDTNIYQVKGEAGQKLLDGQPLPIPPSGSPSSRVDVVTGSNAKASLAKTVIARKASLKAGHVPMIQDADESPALNAYFGGGYDYPNAVALGQLWNETDITQIKTEAGQKLLDGQPLPVAPDNPPAPPENTKGDKARAAFFGAGYTYDDAVTLGNMWNNSNTYQVKAIAGQKLLDGQTLPIAP
jgi:hypothetical protein